MEKTGTLSQKARAPRKSSTKESATKEAVKPKRSSARAAKVSTEMRHQMISDAAYFLAENRSGDNGGDHVEDWLKAEAEIDAMLKKNGKPS